MTLALYIWWISIDKPPTSTPSASDLNSNNRCRHLGGRHSKFVMLACHGFNIPNLPMMKNAFVVAAAVLTTVPLVTPAKALGVKMAQVDMQTGLHLDDPAHYSKDRRRYDSNATVGVGPGGVTVGPRQRCRMQTTTIKRNDGRRITRREHACN
jgi:hypothetical protein